MDRCCFQSFNFVFGMVNYIYMIYIKKECIILFYSDVTEGESNRRGPHLICENEEQSFDIRRPVLFSSFLFVSGVACS